MELLFASRPCLLHVSRGCKYLRFGAFLSYSSDTFLNNLKYDRTRQFLSLAMELFPASSRITSNRLSRLVGPDLAGRTSLSSVNSQDRSFADDLSPAVFRDSRYLRGDIFVVLREKICDGGCGEFIYISLSKLV